MAEPSRTGRHSCRAGQVIQEMRRRPVAVHLSWGKMDSVPKLHSSNIVWVSDKNFSRKTATQILLLSATSISFCSTHAWQNGVTSETGQCTPQAGMVTNGVLDFGKVASGLWQTLFLFQSDWTPLVFTTRFYVVSSFYFCQSGLGIPVWGRDLMLLIGGIFAAELSISLASQLRHKGVGANLFQVSALLTSFYMASSVNLQL